jgi:glycosyltransferase involved in cell wall biosynthesis
MSVSVVIPAHNSGMFIDEAIRSVLSQDWPVDEIIVVNDGSTDRDYECLASIAPNVRVIHQPNRGVSSARNRGCNAATTHYVAILDADDVWLPWKLRAQMLHLTRNPSCDAAFCRGIYWWPEANGTTWTWPPNVATTTDAHIGVRALHYADFLYSIPVAPSTMIAKKDVWTAIGGFDETRQYAEDQDFNFRLSHRFRVDLLEIDGMLYRQHSQSATKKIQDPNHWAAVIYKAIEMLRTTEGPSAEIDSARVRRRLAELHFFHGYDHFWRGRAAVARREFLLAFHNRPMDVKTWAYLLISAIPGLAWAIRNQRRSGKERRLGGGNTSQGVHEKT